MVPLEISLTKSFRPHFGPGVDSASNRNGHQEYLLEGKGSRCVELTTLALHVPIVLKSGNLNLLLPLRPAQALYCNQSNQHTIQFCHQVRCPMEAQWHETIPGCLAVSSASCTLHIWSPFVGDALWHRHSSPVTAATKESIPLPEIEFAKFLGANRKCVESNSQEISTEHNPSGVFTLLLCRDFKFASSFRKTLKTLCTLNVPSTSHIVCNVPLQRILEKFTIVSLKCRYCVTCEIYSRSRSIVVFTELTVSLASPHAVTTNVNNGDCHKYTKFFMQNVCYLCPILVRIEIFVEVPNVNFVNSSVLGIVPLLADGPDITHSHFQHSLSKAHANPTNLCTVCMCVLCLTCIW
jgi:hypothetical protein